ncbi:Epoxide hydrolase [Taphrina deformans PYCC 5710]|uniref:Epoxide hydrolase n=1 Tax=Taphrina deformans (strain PYCC 5710 / ATCC 11124 / CBS 356.35 / IMI 108563 / JCM 9778 / NBRC 8474) TaxID=1097556 RepID=R4X6H6_TAPDE|nr:Epoxide hydrolase [Taphrina deformans PYCC 5710]|eukprot:CCG80724.1 Epoxide hydrolase [Taphrina deformans PYCC 5710]
MIDPDSFPSKYATLNGTRYFYIDQPAQGKLKNTIVLVHGWPDSWYGWRHQIPFLAAEGYRVLCISQVGFGSGTESPRELEKYTIKSVCADLSSLLAHHGVRRAIFWGHDWGGAVVYRMANYYPSLVVAVISLSTPYFPPAKGKYLTLEEMAKAMPNIYLASEKPMLDFSTPEDFRKFFNGLFLPGKGMKMDFTDLAAQEDQAPTPLMPAEELEVFVRQYAETGLGASTNWYRTRRLNFDHDRADFADSEGRLEVPVLFIATTLDPVLKPALSHGMEKVIPKLTRKQVGTGHWGLTEAKDEVNAIVGEFLMRLHLEKMRHQI